ncbi:MAG TPA: hypothetical protein DEH02_03330 [Bacteroidales bacterium]|nr:MAG: hypothetical protein A2X01_00695 [Bacteroidetes bacterium GWF2_35_48]OFY96313.1 MAG: hypothetical protein A2491_04960 [Bacteroidetes bacterium RIFOXYC12_FULL_35_7]HBX50082.1 hypothetical protein [Bacteroidales bacterium]
MEKEIPILKTLLEKASDYGKTSYELVKLKALDKASGIISSYIMNTVVFMLLGLVLLFFSFGIAIWLGDILGKLFYGFFAVTSFYALVAIVLHFIFHKIIKKRIRNSIIKNALK